MELKDKCILLTGASGGIGQAIAKALAHKGAKLILVARNEQKLKILQAALPLAKHHICLGADITTSQGIALITEQANQGGEAGQGIDMLIHGAGGNQFQRLAGRSAASVEQELQLNLVAPITLTQAALTWLNPPRIILNIGSAFGSIGYPGYASYCAAKAGLQRFSEALDRELDGSGTRVLYLAPRATQTSMNSQKVQTLNQKLGNKSDPPEIVAHCVVRMLENETTRQWIGWPEKLFVKINQLFPSLVSASIRKQQAIIKHYLDDVS